MKSHHVYRPPRRNRFLSTFIIFGGGAMLTFMVFYFIPLMQKLEEGLAAQEQDLAPPVRTDPQDEYTPPEIKEEKEVEEKIEMAEVSDDIPIDAPDLPSLTAGTGGKVLINVTPSVALSSGGSVETTGVDSEPVVSSKVSLNVPDSARKILAKRGPTRVIVSGLVDERGTVVEVSIAESSGIPSLDKAAMNALRRYKFKPAIRNGRKAKSRVKMPFKVRVQ